MRWLLKRYRSKSKARVSVSPEEGLRGQNLNSSISPGRLLRRNRSKGEAMAALRPGEQHWQQVPKINILRGERRASANVLVIRGGLVLLLLLAAFLAQNWYRERTAIAERIDAGDTELSARQRELSATQQEIEAIQVQIDQLQRQEESGDRLLRALKELTESQIGWHVTLTALFGVEVLGITFQSVTPQPEGGVTIEGTANGLEAMARLQSRFVGISHILDLQNIQWEAKDTSLEFVVDFRVLR